MWARACVLACKTWGVRDGPRGSSGAIAGQAQSFHGLARRWNEIVCGSAIGKYGRPRDCRGRDRQCGQGVARRGLRVGRCGSGAACREPRVARRAFGAACRGLRVVENSPKRSWRAPCGDRAARMPRALHARQPPRRRASRGRAACVSNRALTRRARARAPILCCTHTSPARSPTFASHCPPLNAAPASRVRTHDRTRCVRAGDIARRPRRTFAAIKTPLNSATCVRVHANYHTAPLTTPTSRTTHRASDRMLAATILSARVTQGNPRQAGAAQGYFGRSDHEHTRRKSCTCCFGRPDREHTRRQSCTRCLRRSDHEHTRCQSYARCGGR